MTRPNTKIHVIHDAVATSTDKCIDFPFAVNNSGYGTVRLDGRAMGAHCAALIIGGRPKTDPKWEARHRCRNRRCINPRHLEWGTRSQNLGRDKLRDGTDNRGTKHNMNKLTEDQVREIRRRAGESMYALGAEFGVHPQTINDIRKGKIWGWLI